MSRNYVVLFCASIALLFINNQVVIAYPVLGDNIDVNRELIRQKHGDYYVDPVRPKYINPIENNNKKNSDETVSKESEPGKPSLNYYLRKANNFRIKGDIENAIKYYGIALKFDPDDESVVSGLVSSWRMAVLANPKASANHIGLGQALQLSGSRKEALKEYNLALRYARGSDKEVAKKLYEQAKIVKLKRSKPITLRELQKNVEHNLSREMKSRKPSYVVVSIYSGKLHSLYTKERKSREIVKMYRSILEFISNREGFQKERWPEPCMDIYSRYHRFLKSYNLDKAKNLENLYL